MPKFAVVMVTQGTRDTQAAAEASVRSQLPAGVDFHVIVDATSNDNLTGWNERIWEARLLADFVAFVDDDDLVENDSIAVLQRCVNETGADLAFTCERITTVYGRKHNLVDRMPHTTPTYANIAEQSMATHHLAFFRTALVGQEVMDAHKATGAPIDWLMRAAVASKGRAVHVPIVGYNWIRYPQGERKRTPAQAYLAGGKIALKWMAGKANARAEVWNP
jgi:hypothetical protein